MTKNHAPLLIVAAGCLWGSMGLFVRALNAMGLASMEIVELRSCIAVVLLAALALRRDRTLLSVRRHQLWTLAACGVCSIVFFNYCYFSTIARMDLSTAAILLYTAPIFVMLLSVVLFRERLTRRKLIALALAFGGCALVCGVADGGVRITPIGLLLGLGSGLGYALYSIFSRFSLNDGLRAVTITIYTFLFAALGGAFLTDFSVYAAAFSAHGAAFVALALVYTVVTTVAPYLLYTTGLQHVENGTASVIASVEPVVATVLGFVVFGESPTASVLLGIGLVLAALATLNMTRTQPDTREEL